MRKIGIIGGVGTGKSFVSMLIKEHFSAYIIQADKVAHKLMRKDNISYNLIVEYFGSSILDDELEIDRKKLGSIVFNDSNKLEKLNQYTNPYVYKEILKEIKELEQRNSNKYLIVEVPLMIEAGFDDLVDELWYIYSDITTRRKRLKINRSYSDEKINSILKNQLDEKAYEQVADYIIDNSFDEEKTLKQIYSILR